MQDMTVATVQLEAVPADKAANLATIEAFVDQAAARQAALVVFPECCITGYWFLRKLSVEAIRALAEPIPDGPSTQRLLALARRHGLSVGAGLVEIGGDGQCYNSYVVAMSDGRHSRHRKLHAFEHSAIANGSDFTVFDLPGGCRAGILVCYDCNLIENVRITALMGAELLIAPHQTGGCRTSNPHLMGLVDRALWDNRAAHPAAIEAELAGEKGRGWLMRWLPSRAHDSGLFLVFSNGVGIDDDEIRTGNAMVLDPYGRIVAETGKASDDMVVAKLDAGLLGQATGRLWLKARRPELYGSLSVRTGEERDARQLKFQE